MESPALEGFAVLFSTSLDGRVWTKRDPKNADQYQMPVSDSSLRLPRSVACRPWGHANHLARGPIRRTTSAARPPAKCPAPYHRAGEGYHRRGRSTRRFGFGGRSLMTATVSSSRLWSAAQRRIAAGARQLHNSGLDKSAHSLAVAPWFQNVRFGVEQRTITRSTGLRLIGTPLDQSG